MFPPKLTSSSLSRTPKVAEILTATVKYNQHIIRDVEFVVRDETRYKLLLSVLQIVPTVGEVINTDIMNVFDKYREFF